MRNGLILTILPPPGSMLQWDTHDPANSPACLRILCTNKHSNQTLCDTKILPQTVHTCEECKGTMP
jgi:hypothetical protein